MNTEKAYELGYLHCLDALPLVGVSAAIAAAYEQGVEDGLAEMKIARKCDCVESTKLERFQLV